MISGDISQYFGGNPVRQLSFVFLLSCAGILVLMPAFYISGAGLGEWYSILFVSLAYVGAFVIIALIDNYLYLMESLHKIHDKLNELDGDDKNGV